MLTFLHYQSYYLRYMFDTWIFLPKIFYMFCYRQTFPSVDVKKVFFYCLVTFQNFGCRNSFALISSNGNNLLGMMIVTPLCCSLAFQLLTFYIVFYCSHLFVLSPKGYYIRKPRNSFNRFSIVYSTVNIFTSYMLHSASICQSVRSVIINFLIYESMI